MARIAQLGGQLVAELPPAGVEQFQAALKQENMTMADLRRNRPWTAAKIDVPIRSRLDALADRAVREFQQNVGEEPDDDQPRRPEVVLLAVERGHVGGERVGAVLWLAINCR